MPFVPSSLLLLVANIIFFEIEQKLHVLGSVHVRVPTSITQKWTAELPAICLQVCGISVYCQKQ